MESVIFCGVQASGKTTFYLKTFFKTHIRISLDQLNTRNKENIFIKTCLDIQQRFVIDNTNATKQERSKYIELSKSKKFKVIGYYFHTELEKAIERNSKRTGKEKIPEVGIRGTYKRMEVPAKDEGFDELYCVESEGDEFLIRNWEKESEE